MNILTNLRNDIQQIIFLHTLINLVNYFTFKGHIYDLYHIESLKGIGPPRRVLCSLYPSIIYLNPFWNFNEGSNSGPLKYSG